MESRLDHLHWELDATPRDTLHITVNPLANVYLMDHDNYRKYCRGDEHMCYGGPAEKNLVILKPNRPGKWHVVVDRDRSGGPVSAAVKNAATGQPVGTAQSRQLKGAQAGELEFREGQTS